MSGPKIPLRFGRSDAQGPEHCHPEGNLPAGAAPWPTGGDAAGHLRAVFHRMGFTDGEIVALSGAHTVGRAHAARSGLNHKAETKYTSGGGLPKGSMTPGGSSWTPNWIVFDNSYFKLVKDKADSECLILETDSVLFEDEKFKCASSVPQCVLSGLFGSRWRTLSRLGFVGGTRRSCSGQAWGCQVPLSL